MFPRDTSKGTFQDTFIVKIMVFQIDLSKARVAMQFAVYAQCTQCTSGGTVLRKPYLGTLDTQTHAVDPALKCDPRHTRSRM